MFVCRGRATKATHCEGYFGCHILKPIFQVCFDPTVNFSCLFIKYHIEICGDCRMAFYLHATIAVGSILAVIFRGSKGPLFLAGKVDYAF